jgi:type IV secretory pathway VirB2 component (pilin)
MRAISAADAVSPAIQRTKEFLFRPFNWGTYLKLGLVAIITEGFGGNLRSSTHSGESPGHGPIVHSPFNLTPEWIAVIAGAVLVAIVVSIVVFYLVTRLRFAFFHCLIHNTKEIGPGWRLYEAPATRFFWLNLVVGFCFLLVVVLVALPFAAGFWRLVHDTPPGGSPDWGLLLSLVLPLIPIILLLVLAGFVIDLTLRDWMLPHFALDNATASEAWSRVWAQIKAEKRQFIVYTLLRVALPTIAMIAMFIVLILPGLMLAGALAAIVYGIHSAFAGSTGAAWMVGILLQVFFGVVAFGIAVLVSICLGGPVSTGIREYALMFYGGRYQALGDILYPPPPRPSEPQTV